MLPQPELQALAPAMKLDQLFEIDACAPAETRQKNINLAYARGLPFVMMRPMRKTPLAIVASGPSAGDFVEGLKLFPGEIWAINGAFNWLRSVGIKPGAFVGLDPDPLLLGYLQDAPKDTTYYIASQCHPSVFDHLKDRNVWLWHANDTMVKPPAGNYPIPGGSTCLTRAPFLAALLGFTDLHIFGGDSSYRGEGYVYGGSPAEGICYANAGGRDFKTTRQMLAQATEMMNTLQNFPGEITVYGSGLMPTMAEEAAANHGKYKKQMAKLWRRAAA